MASKYTPEQKALAYATLEANQGNVKRTARELEIPVATVRLWKQGWEKGGVPEVIEAALPAARSVLVSKLEGLRDKSLKALEMRLDGLTSDHTLLQRINPKDLATTAAILTDKARLVEGKPTSHTEHSGSTGNLPIEQVRELFAGFAKGIVEGARERDASISSAIEEEPIEAEFEEQALPALPSPGSN